MNEDAHCRLREQDLAFFGRVGADVTHEMRNILSVLGEQSGLLDDVLSLAERGKAPDLGKLKGLAAKMMVQVKRGTEGMERFSRFAHATERPTASFDLAALAGNTAALAERQIKRGNCDLAVAVPDEPVLVATNPFSLQRAIFSAIQLVLESLEKGQSLTVTVAARGPVAAICVSGRAAAGAGGLSDRTSELAAAMDELKGDVETSGADGVLSVTLTVPTR